MSEKMDYAAEAREIEDFIPDAAYGQIAKRILALLDKARQAQAAHRPHCQTCTCGMISVEWSDRGGHVDPTNPESVAGIVMNCALDHSYDRTEDGIPYGLEDFSATLAPVVAEHLSAAEPHWQNKSVFMSDEQRTKFHDALIAALGQK